MPLNVIPYNFFNLIVPYFGFLIGHASPPLINRSLFLFLKCLFLKIIQFKSGF
jgi:hypothetical protein